MNTEPWMRGTHGKLDPVVRAVVHALEQAGEDVSRWCDGLDDAAVFARPGGLTPVAFHLRHIVRSLDRLLTYAEGRGLDERQQAGLATELDSGSAEEVRREFREGLARAIARVVVFAPSSFAEERGIGRLRLPTTVGGLLVHCAEHTQRHVGQTVVTAKLVGAGPLIAR